MLTQQITLECEVPGAQHPFDNICSRKLLHLVIDAFCRAHWREKSGRIYFFEDIVRSVHRALLLLLYEIPYGPTLRQYLENKGSKYNKKPCRSLFSTQNSLDDK